jgi:hypothetical protein
MGWRGSAILGAICLIGRVFGADAEKAEEEVSPWETDVTLKGGAGYKKNILLSDFNRESSPFSLFSIDLFAYHLPVNDWEFSEFVTYEDRRYWNSESVDKEITVLAVTDLKRHFGERWKGGLNFDYFYADQVIDASFSEGIPARVQVKMHRLNGGPAAQFNFEGNRRIEIMGRVTRQFFEEPLDDSWEFGPKVVLGQKFGYKSDLTLTGSWRDRGYDTRQVQGVGGDSLHYQQWEAEAGLKYNFDKERHWNARARAGIESSQDNGNGFFDYLKWKISQDVGFTKGGFLANLQGKYLHYDYVNQRGLSGLGRRLSEVTVSVRVEQQIYRRVKAFAEYEHEWVSATDNSDRYRATTFFAGLEWEVK